MMKNAFTPSVYRQSQTHSYSFLPNFCDNHVVFLIILIAELLAVILALAIAENMRDFWINLGLMSLFIQWIALGTVASLCWFNRHTLPMSAPIATLTAFGLAQLITLIFSLLAVWALKDKGDRSGLSILWENYYFIFRNLAISSIISLVALRYFYVQYRWKQNVEAEAQTRLQALQARIRPHFFFNSLNTIASLTRSHRDQAEEAILNLADILRSTLRERERICLQDELETTRRYLYIESLRLGERLRVNWELAPNLPLQMPIPALILQPLVENAIYHGIETRTQGGCITIRIEANRKFLSCRVSNPPPASTLVRHQYGNRIAQDNIRQRLMLAFGQESDFQILESQDLYSVFFRVRREATQ